MSLDETEHWRALDRTGFYGNQGAGCLIMSRKTGRVLLVLRSPMVQEPGTWGGVGGAHKLDEEPVKAALREAHEETGFRGDPEMIPLLVFEQPGFRYRNYLALVDDEFTPQLCWEAVDYQWARLGHFPAPLHFGLVELFSDFESVQTLNHHAGIAG